MGARQIFDAYGGVVSTVELTPEGVVFGQRQDCEAILDANKRAQTLNDGYSPSRDIRRVASIPNVELLRMCREDHIPVLDFMRHPRRYKKWLRSKIYDPDNRHLLTAPHRSNVHPNIIIR